MSILGTTLLFCTLSFICCPVALSAPGQSEYAHVVQNIIWYSVMVRLLRDFPASSMPHRHICAAGLPSWHHEWCQHILVMSHAFVMSCFTLIFQMIMLKSLPQIFINYCQYYSYGDSYLALTKEYYDRLAHFWWIKNFCWIVLLVPT